MGANRQSLEAGIEQHEAGWRGRQHLATGELVNVGNPRHREPRSLGVLPLYEARLLRLSLERALVTFLSIPIHESYVSIVLEFWL